MKQANQQPLDVRYLDKNPLITCTNSYDTHGSDCTSSTNEQEEYPIPTIESPKTDKPYCFDETKTSSKTSIIIEDPPIKDYFKASLFACVTCFWMLGGIVCFVQSLKIRRLLKKKNYQSDEQAKIRSNRLYTNLVLTYVFGGMIIGVLIMTIVVTFVVGIKGYFSKSL